MSAEPIEQLTVPSGSSRLLAPAGPDYATHLATYGRLPNAAGPRVLAQVQLSGLTGRGGAGFPTALKLKAVSGEAVVVANGAEGEPASHKDRHLMLTAPHLVLDGLQVAALITGATEAFVYSRPDAVLAVRQALRERAGAGIDRVAVTVVEAGPGFVAGQETAVVSRLNGGPAVPRYAPVRVTERGVHGRPTLVQNVETLGHLALIARYGGFWFAGLGADDATGTFLATVHDPGGGFGLKPGGGSRVWEVPHGFPLGRLLDAAEPKVQLQAVLVGGFHGTWLPLPDALDAPLSRSGLAPFGGSLGAGVIMPLPTRGCGLEVTAQIVRYLAAESAKQCGPCAFGLPHLAGLASALAAGTAGQSGVRDLRQAVGLVEGRGACHHPDGTARLVRSALTTFEADVRLHQHGRCLARIGETYGGGA